MTPDRDQDPPSDLDPEAVAGQLERIIGKHKDGLSAYEKTWLQTAADYLRYLSTETNRGDTNGE